MCAACSPRWARGSSGTFEKIVFRFILVRVEQTTAHEPPITYLLKHHRIVLFRHLHPRASAHLAHPHARHLPWDRTRATSQTVRDETPRGPARSEHPTRQRGGNTHHVVVLVQHAVQLCLLLDEHLCTFARNLVLCHVGIARPHASFNRPCRPGYGGLLHHPLQSTTHTKTGISHAPETSMSSSPTRTPNNKRKRVMRSQAGKKKGDLCGSATVLQDFKTRSECGRRRRQTSWRGVKPLDAVGRCG